MAAGRNRGLVLAFAGIVVLFTATQAAYRPPPPLAIDAPLGQFSGYRAQAILQDLVGDGVPHPVGSAAAARLREAIVRRLTALGYAAQLQTGTACSESVCATPVNIIATRPGAPPDADAVLLSAHYDSVPAGPGASDDGAGVAALLEAARVLAARPAPRHPIVLLITDGEEAGLLGASVFVRDHPWSKRIKAAVNLEARGTSGPSLMFETGAANDWLMRLYGASVARPVTNSLYYMVYKLLPNDTDFTVFKAAAYQGFNLAFIGHVSRYHTPLDTAANAAPATLQHQGDNALAAVWALAESPTLAHAAAESAFFDVFSRTVMRWPAQWSLPAALAILAALLAQSALLLRGGALVPRTLLWGAAALLFVVSASTAGCAALLELLIAAGKVPPLSGASWNAHPLPMHVAAAALALLGACLASVWFGRRAGFWGSWAAAALGTALLSALCAALAPGAGFALLLGTAAAALAVLPASLMAWAHRTPSAWTMILACVAPLWVLLVAALPVLQFLYPGLGSLAWPVTTALLAVIAANLIALLSAADVWLRRAVTVLAALAVLVGAACAAALPTYSPQWPQRVNVEYRLDADTGRAEYLAQCDSMRLPSALAAAASFDPIPRPRFNGSASLVFHAPAPGMSLAAPELTELPARVGRRFHLQSPRGAPAVLLVFPADAHVGEIDLASARGPIHTRLASLKNGATWIEVLGLPAAGVDFSVAVSSAVTRAEVSDQSYGSAEAGVVARARPPEATSSQDGDTTVVHRTVSLSPAAGR